MTRISHIATILMASAMIPALAFATGANASTTIQAQLGSLPQDVAIQVTQLLEYGDRYEKTIEQILAEHAKLSWVWGTCEQSEILESVQLPES